VQVFDSKNVGSRTLSVSAYTVHDGNSGGNYTVSTPTASGSITPKHLTVTANNKSMILNGTVPTLTYVISGFATGETLGTSGVAGAASCATANGTAVGTFPIVCTVGGLTAQNYDFPAGNFVQGNLIVQYAVSSAACGGTTDPSRTVLQPVNPDGSSVFKKGSTVPVKFRVCDAKGVSIGPGVGGAGIVTGTGAPVYVSSTKGASAVDEAVYSTTPDTSFRWSATDQQWIFNQNTGNLVSGNVYTYVIPLNDGTSISYKFGVK
jgi:hypothetical protein